MKKSKKFLIGTGLGSLALAGIIAIPVFAYQGDPAVQGPNYTPERHDQMTQAFEGNDYQAWKELMEQNTRRGRVMDVVNEDNFAQFAEAHRLALAGDREGAVAIRAELGLGTGGGQGRGMKDGSGRGARRGAGNCPYQNQQ